MKKRGGRRRRNNSRDLGYAKPKRAKTDRNTTRGGSTPPPVGHPSFEETAMEMGTSFLQLMTTMTDQSKKVMVYGREKKSVIRI
jgi:hypothetical protein